MVAGVSKAQKTAIFIPKALGVKLQNFIGLAF